MEEMTEEIINSKLVPVKKLFLVTEWILRDYLPYELQSVKLSDFRARVKSFATKRLPPGFLENALGKVGSILHVENREQALSLIIGLAYYSYIGSEIVYEHETRLEMMSRVSELGLKLSEVERLYEKWVSTIGDSETLFNEVFTK